MKVALDGRPERTRERPQELVNVRINAVTGKPTGSGDPQAIFETFRTEKRT